VRLGRSYRDCGDLRPGLRQEVRRECMLDGLAAHTHGFRVRVKTLLNGLQQVLVLRWLQPLNTSRMVSLLPPALLLLHQKNAETND
jgi:hypothetical protein